MPARPLFSKVGVALIGVVAAANVVSANQAPIAVGVAPLFVGEEKIVEGVVTAVEKDVNVVTLRLGTPPQSLTVSLIIGLLTRFPTKPEVYYAGKTVLVGGIIEKFRNELEMTIRDPARIEVVDLEMASDPKLREQQEAMKAKVQSLEERIRQLEAEQQKPQGQPPPE